MDILFHHSKYAKYFAFKGGTSLSKSFNIIKRFSEDIDLILDWRVLGYHNNEPWDERSKKAQLRFNEEARSRASKWIQETLLPDLNEQLKANNLNNFQLIIQPDDSRTIEVHYPNSFSEIGILQEIRLEIGPMSAWTPHSDYNISPYVASVFPHLFDYTSVKIPTVEAKRTFWEKATILHKEANRKKNFTPKRYSRHYYDMYMMSQSYAKEKALSDFELLRKVVEFKMKFFADNTAKYEDATPLKLKLSPQESQMGKLSEDYLLMQGMMFGDLPSFEEIIDGIKKLELEIHELGMKMLF
ncbi:MAG: nucleotidyl transferase AbiEii/AbiGii toxin family protein [Streptococcaceae bacterium]|jgi:hypothetical protein|nr:nucleotidyl transferase AbiEii/AbiGii toxin family protein [Streptococcaceae bacterium]